MDYTGSLRGLVALVVGPRPYLLWPCSEECLQIEKGVCTLDKPYYPRLFQPYLFKEHFALFITVQFGNFRLDFGCNDQNLRIFVLNRFFHSFYILITLFCTCFIYIAYIHYRFVGKQEEFSCQFLFLRIVECNRTGRFPLFENTFVFEQYFVEFLCVLVSSGLGLLLHLMYSVLYGLQIFKLQFCVYDFLVADRVHAAVYMYNVGIIEAAEYMQDGICLPDVCKELVAEPLSFARPLYQAGNVYNFYRCGNYPLGVDKLFQNLKSFIWNYRRANVGFYGTKRKICRLRLPRTDTVKKS